MHLFAGAGGGILGGMMLGHEPVCAVEIDKYCRRVLQARQDDGSLPPFPIYEDVRKFDGHAWRGLVDVICGGFPCQPFSCAGKQLGTADPRHLWPEMARIIEEVRPRYVFAENVSISAFEEPWRDLRRLGYRVPPAICVSASDVGAPHLRKRWWLLATDDRDADYKPQSTQPEVCEGANAKCVRDGNATDAERIRLRNKPGRELGAGGQGAPWSEHDGTQEPVADAPSAQNHQKRGDCQCGRNAMGRNQQAPQQDNEQADHLLPCGLCGNVARSDTNTDSGRLKERGERYSQPETRQQAPCGHGVDRLRAPADTESDRRIEGQQDQRRCREGVQARQECGSWDGGGNATDTSSPRLERHRHGPLGVSTAHTSIGDPCWWSTEPNVGRVAHAVASRVDRLKAIGNGQVPLTAATAWRLLMEAHA